ncbi:Brix-domain-containing protein [Wallemia mellicola]|uniref:Brix-domain-containing protein n=2 Tax=Wallemia mellicola TaxID=1708541 RepID=A0A4T0N3I7_9BASI|nr:Brix-domain-containing protein [Wallemia mellicola CBS 633.66]TIB71459.1 hypothetical protein E3Q24_02278 [Wallemia mellicola]EIM19469.1 Brix-domain-containing protein [Wallemia mellicola CBS 633.66]TIB75388.1 hypothetical protein E3Q23_02410 [Wallemia mellicola]TIB78181.1 Brix-domain-containing protein [Wallemia mellicola]TIB91025.1 Brix-domain-containing protein [Wallemia mellicola]|eukprot:XP_006960501.1 Brix-domain-containing protein [Wallemia mellicola CBS 633.66]
MARRSREKKNRTHKKGGLLSHAPGAEETAGVKIPKSFVIKSGDVGKSVNQLVKEIRGILEPNTATRLKERKKNKLPDFLALTGTLGLTHIVIFTRSANHVNMRLARTPKGPTLHFRVERYSLMADLRNASKKIGNLANTHKVPPLLVLNGFPQDSRPHKLAAQLFQSLFPPLDVSNLPLSQARRLLLLSYNPTTKTIDMRHYEITVKPHGVSKRVRRVVPGASTANKLPNLSNVQDISQYILGQENSGYESAVTSDSEVESEVDEAGQPVRVVQLAEDFVGRGNKKDEKRAIKLKEIGPRLEISLVKVTTGLAGSQPKKHGMGGNNEGEVLFHDHVNKSKKEVKDLAKKHAERKAEIARRRKEQEENVERKRKDKEARKAKGETVEDDEEIDEEEVNDDFDDIGDPEEDLENLDFDEPSDEESERESDSESEDEEISNKKLKLN